MTQPAVVGSEPVAGPILFARYAFGPNRLGYCGTDDHDAVLGYAAAGEPTPLRQLARSFDGAYPYLELIAAANDIADPLDRRVVEAYWLGNGLTSRVRRRGLHRNVGERFRSRTSPRTWRRLEAGVAGGAHPVHAFHVFDVFPLIGMLRGGTVDDALAVIDSCRIRWGTVRAVEAGSLVVDVARLSERDGRLELDEPTPGVVERWVDGTGFVDDVRPGDVVSIHWGWACDRLTPRQVANLSASTQRELQIANAGHV
jgi:hypothetical protein